MLSWRRSTRKSERGTRNRQVALLFRVPPSAFRVLPSRDQRAPGNLRLHRLPRERAERLPPHGEGLCPRRRRLRGVLRALLRRPLELGRCRPAGGPGLARRHAAARPGQALGGARPLGAAHVLPVPRRHARARGQPRQGRAHAEARARAPHVPGPLRERPGSRVGPGESARQGQEGAHRAGGQPRGAGVAALLPASRRGGRGGRGNGGPARGVRGPARQASHPAQRAARGQAAVGRTPARARLARAFAAAFVRHAPARRGCGPAGRAGAAGPRVARDHAGVYSYVGGTVEKGVPSSASEGMTRIHSTTILAVRRDGHVALGGDGQVTLGDTVMKANANKVRALKGGKILAGFAGASADAFTLFEKFEEKLERYPGNLPRAAVELAKDWRSDRVLRRLEALLVVADKEHGYVISGSGELIEPDDSVLAIGSGGTYALAAARALLRSSDLPAKDIG